MKTFFSRAFIIAGGTVIGYLLLTAMDADINNRELVLNLAYHPYVVSFLSGIDLIIIGLSFL